MGSLTCVAQRFKSGIWHNWFDKIETIFKLDTFDCKIEITLSSKIQSQSRHISLHN